MANLMHEEIEEFLAEPEPSEKASRQRGRLMFPHALWPYLISGFMVTSAVLIGVGLGAWLTGH